jgi:hypothetical protein
MKDVQTSQEHGGRAKYSLRPERDWTKCVTDHVGPWRRVECQGPVAGDGRDLVECAECGAQKSVPCTFGEW